MVSFWSKKKDDSPRPEESSQGPDEEHDHEPVPAYSEPTERTRLLAPDNQGYLSPEDPAVSDSLCSSYTFLS